MRAPWVGLVVVAGVVGCVPNESVCANGQQRCDGDCYDLSSSNEHCGVCGISCGSELTCRGGQCVSGCNLASGFVDAGTIGELAECLACDPQQATNKLTPREDGVPCNHGVCLEGGCAAGCFIDGGFVSVDTVNPSNSCERCSLFGDTNAWSASADGTDCGSGRLCQSGVCGDHCRIDGLLYAPGDRAPNDPCRACVIETSTTQWTPLVDATACGAGRFCNNAQCTPGCTIDGVLRDEHESNPANPCEQCSPLESATSWTALNDGASCGAGEVCNAGACLDQCFIDGDFVDAGVADPANLCHACVPASSTTAYSARGTVTLLTPGAGVSAQGWSTAAIGTHSLTDDGGVITLSTSTTGSVGGAQLLYRRISSDGGPFTLRVEWRVDAVNAHNQFDSAAAILGRFNQPPFGDNTDRAQMAYVDPTRVGWASDTQSSLVGLDGGFHVYELAVTADAGARFSVDGVPLLSRGDFVTNGVIAIGDQTNDANVESTLSVHSVSLLCE